LSSIEIHDDVNVRAASLPGAERTLAEEALSFVARHRGVLRRRDGRCDDMRSDAFSRFLAEHELYAPAQESYEWLDGEKPQLKQREREDARVSARDQMDVRIADIRGSHDDHVLDRQAVDDNFVCFLACPANGDLA
jgi:hypothetical protein